MSRSRKNVTDYLVLYGKKEQDLRIKSLVLL